MRDTMHHRIGRRLAATLAVLLLGVGTALAQGDAAATRALPLPELRRDLVDLVAPVVKESWRSVVGLRSELHRRPAALGFAVAEGGLVLSKLSEIEKIEDLKAVLDDGRELVAKIVARQPSHDLALVEIEGADLAPLSFATAGSPGIGSLLVTVGARSRPLGVGVLSVGEREIPSGGGFFGVSIEDDPEGRGARVTEVHDGSAAKEAGVRIGDVIVRVEDRDVRDRDTMIGTVSRFDPGTKIAVDLLRGAEKVGVEAVLGSRLEALSRGRSSPWGRLQYDGLSTRRSGFPKALTHDTPLDSRECGSPVLDLDGRVVALNIARAGRTQTYAIPAAELTPLVTTMVAESKKTQ